MKLFFNAFLKLITGAAFVFLLLFLPAGTFDYFGAWLFIVTLFVPMIVLGIVMLMFARGLLARRLDTKEKEKVQIGIVAASAVLFIAIFVIAGFDFRFAWSDMPQWISLVAAAIFLFGYAFYAEVLRENEYLSRTIKVEEGQSVVDTGVYAFVRHPMYLATVIMFFAIPVILGSWISFALVVFYPVVIVIRIKNEEKLLENNLVGYKAYKEKVKYRLIPFVW